MKPAADAFETAVAATSGLGPKSFHAGLQALRAADRARIECDDTRKLSGSVDVDTSLKPILEDAHRWDYAIGYRKNGEVIYWVEVHPASPGDVSEVQRKFACAQKTCPGRSTGIWPNTANRVRWTSALPTPSPGVSPG